MNNIYLKLFAIFCKIGMFTIGGGYAMVPLIEDELIEKRKWVAKEDFVSIICLTSAQVYVLPASSSASLSSIHALISSMV